MYKHPVLSLSKLQGQNENSWILCVNQSEEFWTCLHYIEANAYFYFLLAQKEVGFIVAFFSLFVFSLLLKIIFSHLIYPD